MYTVLPVECRYHVFEYVVVNIYTLEMLFAKMDKTHYFVFPYFNIISYQNIYLSHMYYAEELPRLSVINKSKKVVSRIKEIDYGYYIYVNDYINWNTKEEIKYLAHKLTCLLYHKTGLHLYITKSIFSKLINVNRRLYKNNIKFDINAPYEYEDLKEHVFKKKRNKITRYKPRRKHVKNHKKYLYKVI